MSFAHDWIRVIVAFVAGGGLAMAFAVVPSLLRFRQESTDNPEQVYLIDRMDVMMFGRFNMLATIASLLAATGTFALGRPEIQGILLLAAAGLLVIKIGLDSLLRRKMRLTQGKAGFITLVDRLPLVVLTIAVILLSGADLVI